MQTHEYICAHNSSRAIFIMQNADSLKTRVSMHDQPAKN